MTDYAHIFSSTIQKILGLNRNVELHLLKTYNKRERKVEEIWNKKNRGEGNETWRQLGSEQGDNYLDAITMSFLRTGAIAPYFFAGQLINKYDISTFPDDKVIDAINVLFQPSISNRVFSPLRQLITNVCIIRL